jgi:hypothetical protein
VSPPRARRAAALACLALASCTTTRIVDTWRDPALARSPFERILVVFQGDDAAQRRDLEDLMAREIPRSTPGYRLFPERPATVEAARARVREAGYDTVVIVGVTGVDRRPVYRPAPGLAYPYEPSLWRAWEADWSLVYRPGTVRTETTVHLLTRVYVTAEDKLVWAAKSDSLDPASLASALRETVHANSLAAARAIREAR